MNGWRGHIGDCPAIFAVKLATRRLRLNIFNCRGALPKAKSRGILSHAVVGRRHRAEKRTIARAIQLLRCEMNDASQARIRTTICDINIVCRAAHLNVCSPKISMRPY